MTNNDIVDNNRWYLAWHRASSNYGECLVSGYNWLITL